MKHSESMEQLKAEMRNNLIWYVESFCFKSTPEVEIARIPVYLHIFLFISLNINN